MTLGVRGSSVVAEGKVSRRLEENRAFVERELGVGTSFDVIVRKLHIAGRDAFMVAIDGFVQADILVHVTHFLQRVRAEELTPLSADRLLTHRVGYIETETEADLDLIIVRVLSGFTALFIDGEDQAILMEARKYPGRQPDEPVLEKVMRGPRDGFTETLLHNTALIRRRLRDPHLRLEVIPVGERSRTDVAIVYIEDVADPGLVREVRERIKQVRVDGLPMAEKSLEEFITPRKKWWNPFPVLRFTERPDTAAVHLLEGHIVVLVDTSPVAIILPATFFHHMQHAEEFHQDVIVGVFFRFVRYLALFIAGLATPLWVAAALSQDMLPEFLKFIGPREPAKVPLFLQFLFGELGIELIRMSLIHTPSGLTTSLGIIGAVLLGEMAIKVGLFSPEAVLYVALAALGFFAIPSQELAAAVRLVRLVLLVVAGILKLPGVLFGIVVMFVLLILRTDSFGVPYLWPLIPFNGRALLDVLVRLPAPMMNRRHRFARKGAVARR